MPKISVIIPTYNRAMLLRSAINSVLSQTYDDYEIIVIDDGSTDDTAEVVKEFPADKLRYVFQENNGRSAARNNGIKIARGEYIAFLDSDDLFLPTKLELQAQFLDNNPDYGLVYSFAKTVDESGKLLHQYFYEGDLSGWIYPDLLSLRNNVITTPTVMVRAQIIAELGGFDETMDICEDLDLWCRIARTYEVMQIRQHLASIGLRSGERLNIIESVAARKRYYRNAMARDPELIALKKELYAEMYNVYLNCAVNQKRWLMVLYLSFLAFINDPKRVITTIVQRLKSVWHP